MAKAVRRAGPIVEKIEADRGRLLEALAHALHPKWEATWRGDARALTRAAFMKRHRLMSVVVTEGRTTLYYSSGGLFTDHGAEIRMSGRGKVTEILIS